MFFLYLNDMFLRVAILGLVGRYPKSRRPGCQCQSPALRSFALALHSNQCTIRKLLPANTCNGPIPMIGKRVQFHDETWQELRLLAAESMKSFQELADEAFNDLLKKHGRPNSLKEALRRSAGQTAKVIPLKRKKPSQKGRS
jgi:hypothetical protein